MAKSKSAERVNTARIQRAITGLQIPMMSIVRLGKCCDQWIAEGASDEQLAANCAAFVASIS